MTISEIKQRYELPVLHCKLTKFELTLKNGDQSWFDVYFMYGEISIHRVMNKEQLETVLWHHYYELGKPMPKDLI